MRRLMIGKRSLHVMEPAHRRDCLRSVVSLIAFLAILLQILSLVSCGDCFRLNIALVMSCETVLQFFRARLAPPISLVDVEMCRDRRW